MKCLPNRSLISCGLIVASLAFGGNAFAADSHAATGVNVGHVAHVRVAKHVAARRHYAVARPDSLGQFLATFFGGGFAVGAGSGSYDDSPTYDSSPSPSVDSSSNDAQAASDAANQAIQQMNDTNALNASMQAAEQQNDAANAATLQTEINAGM
jgi:hypothetical protein